MSAKRLSSLFVSLIAFLTLVMSVLRLIPLRSSWGLRFWVLKIMTGAHAPLMVLGGMVAGLLGLRLGQPLAVLAGLGGAALSARYVRDVTAKGVDYSPVFGPAWEQVVAARRTPAMTASRWQVGIVRPPVPRFQQDLAFATVPGTDRALLCDLWQPGEGVEPSGVGVIYFHGSGWYLSDKDAGTRPFFRHLTAQGHVVMDVAYRMCPETDLDGMVADVKRSVAWMADHAAELGVDRGRIVLCGGSAGAHLSMLAGFIPDHPLLTPPDLAHRDLSVAGIISIYGPADMRATAEHNQTIGFPSFRADLAEAEPISPPPRQSDAWQKYQLLQWKRLGNLTWDLLGGTMTEVPDRYDLASPILHVHAGCPPTLLIQSAQDILVSVESVRMLHERMVAAGAPVLYLELPNTDHGFDLFMPTLSPPAQAAWYEVDRFLVLVG